MNENKQNQINVIEYLIRANGDNTYRVSIQTDSCTITYDRARVIFGFNESSSIVFPLGIQVLNSKDDIVMNYILNLQQPSEQSLEQPSEQPLEQDT